MDKLDKIGVGNVPPLPKNTKTVVAEDYNKLVDKINSMIDNLTEFIESDVTVYTIGLTDAGKYITSTSDSAVKVTIGVNDILVGTTITLEQNGEGTVTVEVDGVTVNGGLSTPSQYTILALTKKSATEWICIGGTN